MKIYVLADNTDGPGLKGEWGLSFYIEYNGKTVLLDAGVGPCVIGHVARGISCDKLLFSDCQTGIGPVLGKRTGSHLKGFYMAGREIQHETDDNVKKNCTENNGPDTWLKILPDRRPSRSSLFCVAVAEIIQTLPPCFQAGAVACACGSPICVTIQFCCRILQRGYDSLLKFRYECFHINTG